MTRYVICTRSREAEACGDDIGKDVTRHPVLADLARLADARSERRSGLLQSLLESDSAQAGALVCFPYAGGNAVNFHPMARALRGSGLAVYAVELPGHDLAAESEPFASMARVVGQVVAEITRRGLTRVLLRGALLGRRSRRWASICSPPPWACCGYRQCR